MGLGWRWVGAVVGSIVGVVPLMLAATAGAATVTAAEGPLFKSPGLRYASATVEAQPDEANRLSISVTGDPGHYLLQVRDAAGPLQAGSGCEGGGAGNAVVTCAMSVQPGSVTVILGNRGSAVDAGSLSSAVYVWGGSGDDLVTTGSGSDAFFPTRCGPNTLPVLQCDPELGDGDTGTDHVSTGAGDDFVELGNRPSEVRTGPDNDRVIVPEAPNGPDLIDLGAGDGDVADYHLRNEAVTYVADGLADDGAAGENDNVLGAEFFATGAGKDLLIGDGDSDYLFGGGGDDTLVGKGGDDLLVGEYGEEDNLGFVAGVDVTRFWSSYPTPFDLDVEAGNDTARGGSGDDRLRLDGGDDTGMGGPGADRIWGDAGGDLLLGRRGRNWLDGDGGHDRCRGGSRRSIVLNCDDQRRLG